MLISEGQHTNTHTQDFKLDLPAIRRRRTKTKAASVAGDLKRALGQTRATASILSGRAGLTSVAMETELRSKRQPAAEGGRVVVAGLTRKSSFFFFF